MRKLFTALLLALIAVSFGVADDKFVRVEQNLDIPSFIGWDNERVIVVLKKEVAVDHARDKMSAQALANYPAFEPLLQRFAVRGSAPQFAGADRQRGGEELARHYMMTIGKGTVDEAKAAFERNPNVERVELIGIHTIFATPNDPYYQGYPNPDFPYDQWHYYANHSIDADQAWDANSGSSTVLVGILDSGTRYFHLDLGGNSAQWGPNNPYAGGNIFINPGEIPGDGIDNDGNGYVDDVIGYDFIATTGGAGVTCIDQDCGTKDNDPDDGNGHGTHVAGTVGAITNNARLVAGVAGGYSDGTTSGVGNGVRLVPCRMGYHARYLGMTTGLVDMAAAAEAMYYMAGLKDAGHNVAAINCSWGNSNSGGLGAAADYLLSRDVVIVVAAGNSNSTSASYLSSRGDCLDVAATDKNGNGASFSNYGSWVDVAAPGVEILSTYRNPSDSDPAAHYIALLDGTSMAAPHVTGIIALLESCNPSLTGPQKRSLVMNNTNPYSDSRYLGTGIANAYKALNAANCASCTETVPVANFSGSPTSGDAPLTVNFTDLSANNPASWSWTFGDGGTSTAKNPSHTYNAAGTYTVSLTATNCAGSDTETKSGYIVVSDAPCTATTPVANFSASPTSGDAPLTVYFTDLSTNVPDMWSWDFGDGGTSSAQNPSHTYSAAGSYTVTLTSANCAGSDVETKVDYVTVTQPQQQELHVQNIVVTRAAAGGPNRVGQATVTIYNQAGQPVSGATVSGFFNAPNTSTKTATTNSSGVAVLQSDKTRTPPADWCFEVTNVTATNYAYNSAANVVTRACESGFVFSAKGAADATVPETYGLFQNYPNPFNPTTEISFALQNGTHVMLEVFNISGQQVAVIADGYFSAGVHTVTWDASGVSSGIYLYRLTSSEFSDSRKMILLK